MAFFGSFLHAPPAALRHIPLDFDRGKVLRWCIYHVAFIYIWLIIPKFSNFRCFHTSRKYHFRVPSGWFFGRNHLKWCQISLKFWPVIQYKVPLSGATLIDFSPFSWIISSSFHQTLQNSRLKSLRPFRKHARKHCVSSL